MKKSVILTNDGDDARNLLNDGRKTAQAHALRAAILKALTPEQRKGINSDPNYCARILIDYTPAGIYPERCSIIAFERVSTAEGEE